MQIVETRNERELYGKESKIKGLTCGLLASTTQEKFHTSS